MQSFMSCTSRPKKNWTFLKPAIPGLPRRHAYITSGLKSKVTLPWDPRSNATRQLRRQAIEMRFARPWQMAEYRFWRQIMHLTWEEKQGTYFRAPSGLPLIQHTLLLMLEMCEQNCFSPELIVDRACHAPARLFQLQDRGYLREGYWADLVIVDPSQKTQVKDSKLFSKCGWSPFSHLTFTNSIETTVVSKTNCISSERLYMGCRGQRAKFESDRR